MVGLQNTLYTANSSSLARSASLLPIQSPFSSNRAWSLRDNNPVSAVPAGTLPADSPKTNSALISSILLRRIEPALMASFWLGSRPISSAARPEESSVAKSPGLST